MNLFYLDKDPRLAAEYQCDRHICKMILETAQLLSTAYRILDGDFAPSGLYKITHVNHPVSKWVRSGVEQYRWTWDHWCFLLQEYNFRYEKIHSCDKLREALYLSPRNIDWDASWSDPPLCMPEQYKIEGNPVESYRNYYRGEKIKFATWKRRSVPEWFHLNKKEGTL